MGSSVILPAPGQPVEGPDAGFVSAASPAAVDFLTTGIAPPAPLYLARDDQLGIVVYSNLAGLTVNVSGRILLPAGTTLGQPLQPDAKPGGMPTIKAPLIQPFLRTFAPTTARARNHFFLDLFECFVLGVQVYAGGVPFTRGNIFVYLELNRGGTVSTFGTQTLLADYVHPAQALTWPGGRNISPIEGPGFLRSINVANPAAGAEWTLTVPTGARWRPQSARFTLVTSATVANRVVECNLQDPTPSSVFLGNPTASVPASSTVQVTFSSTIPTAAANIVDIMSAMPSADYLPAGWSIGTRTTNLQVGDQYSSIFVNVEEWLDPAT